MTIPLTAIQKVKRWRRVMSNRICIDVEYQLAQICFINGRDRFESIPKHGASTLQPLVKKLSIAAIDIAHHFGKVIVRWLKKEVVVIGHQSKGVAVTVMLQKVGFQNFDKLFAAGIVGKKYNGIDTVSHYVMSISELMKSGFSGH